jgi:hypothetical protein
VLDELGIRGQIDWAATIIDAASVLSRHRLIVCHKRHGFYSLLSALPPWPPSPATRNSAN